MIDALIQGKIYGQPQQRTAKTGKPFAVTKVRVAQGDGDTLFVSVIAFDAQPCSALLALGDGDSIAITGTLTAKVWTDKQGQPKPALDLIAQQVMTPYQVTRKRKAVANDGRQHQPGDDFPHSDDPRDYQ
jgi:single-stranded DNA-binding protein